MTITARISLEHHDGTTTAYTGQPVQTPVRKATITCQMGRPSDMITSRLEMVTAELAGPAWDALLAAGAVPAMERRLTAATQTLLDGNMPCVILKMEPGRPIESPRLVLNAVDAAHRMRQAHHHSLKVPRQLPYQLGGPEDGTYAVVYVPRTGGGMLVESLHASDESAQQAKAALLTRADVRTAGCIRVETDATALLRAVVRGEFDAQADAQAAQGSGAPVSAA